MVDVSVSILGDASEPGAKIVQASGSNVINVTANDVVITGLTVRNGNAGIAITGADGCRIEGCNLTNNKGAYPSLVASPTC